MVADLMVGPSTIASRAHPIAGHFHRGADPTAPLIVGIHGGGCNSGYFDLPGCSLRREATARGAAVLLVDRPGHGISPAIPGLSLAAIAVDIEDMVGTALALSGTAPARIVAIGHSIGAMVAVELVARALLPWTGLAISGLGHRPSPASLAWFGVQRSGLLPPLPHDFFFGAEGSYDWRAPIALRRIAEPWSREEVREILEDWPARFAATAARVAVPVHFRLADHERIWNATEADIREIAAAFVRAPVVDAAILRDGGHLYEVHKAGPQLVDAQLAFALGGLR